MSNSKESFTSRAVDGVLYVGLAGLFIYRLNQRFGFQDANWDLLNYHSYVPTSIYTGQFLTDFHPAGMPGLLFPFQDLIVWPLVHLIPGWLATLFLSLAHLLLVIPTSQIVQILAPRTSTKRSIVISLFSLTGFAFMSEFGTVIGDVFPAILFLFAIVQLFRAQNNWGEDASTRRLVNFGILIAFACLLKMNVVIFLPGLVIIIAIAKAVPILRIARALVPAALMSAVIFLPWATYSQIRYGSPIFPLLNALFKAPQYPATNTIDDRWKVTNVVELLTLPLKQLLGTSQTSEIPFIDVRWLLVFALTFMYLVKVLVFSSQNISIATQVQKLRKDNLLLLLIFWVSSYIFWALQFGVQRYALLLEALCIPLIYALVLRIFDSKVSYRLSLCSLLIVGVCTSYVNFGRTASTDTPLVPQVAIESLEPFDAVIVGEFPAAFLASTSRTKGQAWFGIPFNKFDAKMERNLLSKKQKIGVIFFLGNSSQTIERLSLLGVPEFSDCEPFRSPIDFSLQLNKGNETWYEVCDAKFAK